MYAVVVLVFTITGAAVVNSHCHVQAPIQVITGNAAPCVIQKQEVEKQTTVCNVDLKCKFDVLHACVSSICTYVLETCHKIQHSSGSIQCLLSRKRRNIRKKREVEEQTTTEMEEPTPVIDFMTAPPETTTTVIRPPRA